MLLLAPGLRAEYQYNAYEKNPSVNILHYNPVIKMQVLFDKLVRGHHYPLMTEVYVELDEDADPDSSSCAMTTFETWGKPKAEGMEYELSLQPSSIRGQYTWIGRKYAINDEDENGDRIGIVSIRKAILRTYENGAVMGRIELNGGADILTTQNWHD